MNAPLPHFTATITKFLFAIVVGSGKNKTMYSMPYTLVSLLVLAAGVSPALASEFDRSGVRGETFCFPAKFAVNIIDNLRGVKAERRDVVDITMNPRFLIYDGGSLPDRYFLKADNNAETEFTISDDGTVPDFLKIAGSADKRGDICIEDAARAGLAADDESLYFEMGLTPYFRNHSGVHSMDELLEGARDGRSLYKMLIPGALRLFMPSTDHMSVRYDDPEALPLITAIKDGNSIGIIPTGRYNGAFVFDCKDAEALGADSITIEGGTYRLAPVPSIKTMKRYGIGKPRGPQAKP